MQWVYWIQRKILFSPFIEKHLPLLVSYLAKNWKTIGIRVPEDTEMYPPMPTQDK